MNITKITVTALAIVWTVAAAGRLSVFEIKEHAAEVSELVLTGGAQQLLYVRQCDECDPVTVSITAKTQYYDHRTLVGAARAARMTDRDATVFFDPETKVVTRIVFWKKVTS